MLNAPPPCLNRKAEPGRHSIRLRLPSRTTFDVGPSREARQPARIRDVIAPTRGSAGPRLLYLNGWIHHGCAHRAVRPKGPRFLARAQTVWSGALYSAFQSLFSAFQSLMSALTLNDPLERSTGSAWSLLRLLTGSGSSPTPQRRSSCPRGRAPETRICPGFGVPRRVSGHISAFYEALLGRPGCGCTQQPLPQSAAGCVTLGRLLHLSELSQ